MKLNKVSKRKFTSLFTLSESAPGLHPLPAARTLRRSPQLVLPAAPLAASLFAALLPWSSSDGTIVS